MDSHHSIFLNVGRLIHFPNFLLHATFGRIIFVSVNLCQINNMNKPGRTITKTVFLGAFMLISVFNISCGQTKTDKLEKLISAYAQYGQFNGSVLVAEKGNIIYKKGFGLADMEWNIPNQPDTKFRLGSITKQFTSMLILQLVQQGKLKLELPISNYLPDYPKKNGDAITIHHLLTHTSGIPDFTSFPDFFKDRSRNTYSPEELVNYFADSTLQFKPGEQFEYSNSGYVLLGLIMEKVTGKSYEDLLKDNILFPLRMNNTGYDHNRTLLKNRASGYDKNGLDYVNASFLDMSIPYSAGAIYSTVEDLFLWNQALYTEKLLPKKYMDLLFTKYVWADGSYYGYGWFIGEMHIGNTEEHLQTISHGGSINGFGTLITRIPSDQSFIVLLNNTGSAPLREMTTAIGGIIYDQSYDFPKKSVAYSMLGRIEKDGITTALSFYKMIKDSNDYYLNEYEMNLVGYHFLQSDSAKEAASVFGLIVEAYPHSFNAYDSYGEALMVLGNKAEAIENYKKSVRLNPHSGSGLKALKEASVNTDTLIKKIPVEHLKLLEGKYTSTEGDWKIEFKEVNGELVANDKGYRYKLIPVEGNEFINPDDGASLLFDTLDKNAITLLLFGKFKFRKTM
jgi:CubicO group peptidase (beta-lactamase class C family)